MMTSIYMNAYEPAYALREMMYQYDDPSAEDSDGPEAADALILARAALAKADGR